MSPLSSFVVLCEQETQNRMGLPARLFGCGLRPFHARLSHVPTSLTGLNGDLFKLAPEVKVLKQAVRAGRIALQQS